VSESGPVWFRPGVIAGAAELDLGGELLALFALDLGQGLERLPALGLVLGVGEHLVRGHEGVLEDQVFLLGQGLEIVNHGPLEGVALPEAAVEVGVDGGVILE
jgi:hypothetical protein